MNIFHTARFIALILLGLSIGLSSCIEKNSAPPIITAGSRSDVGPYIEFHFGNDKLTATRIRGGRYLVEPISIGSGRPVTSRHHSIIAVHEIDGLSTDEQFLIWELYYCGRYFCPDFNLGNKGAIGLMRITDNDLERPRKRVELAIFNAPFLGNGEAFTPSARSRSLDFTRKIVAIGRKHNVDLLPHGRTANEDVTFPFDNPKLEDLSAFYRELLLDGLICVPKNEEKVCDPVLIKR